MVSVEAAGEILLVYILITALAVIRCVLNVPKLYKIVSPKNDELMSAFIAWT